MTRWWEWLLRRGEKCTDARAWAGVAQLYSIQARKAADRAERAARDTDRAADRIAEALQQAARDTTASDGGEPPQVGR